MNIYYSRKYLKNTTDYCTIDSTKFLRPCLTSPAKKFPLKWQTSNGHLITFTIMSNDIVSVSEQRYPVDFYTQDLVCRNPPRVMKVIQLNGLP